MKYLGLDVGKRYVQACLLNDDGSVVRERRYRYDEDGLRDILSLLNADIIGLKKDISVILGSGDTGALLIGAGIINLREALI